MSEGAAAEGGKILGVTWQKNWGWVAKFFGWNGKVFWSGEANKVLPPYPLPNLFASK